MGCRQCLPLSVFKLKGKHCRKPHCRNGVVDTFGHWMLNLKYWLLTGFKKLTKITKILPIDSVEMDLQLHNSVDRLTHCPNVSTTPLRQWGFQQCLSFSWTALRGKHCRHPIAVMGVVNTFGPWLRQVCNNAARRCCPAVPSILSKSGRTIAHPAHLPFTPLLGICSLNAELYVIIMQLRVLIGQRLPRLSFMGSRQGFLWSVPILNLIYSCL